VSFKRLATKVLPFAKVLGTALGGPAGPVVNIALDTLGKQLGVDPTETAIEAALLHDPDALLKLKQADQALEAEMKRLDVDIFALEVQGQSSARELAKKNMLPQVILSAVFIVGYFWILDSLFSGDITIPENLRAEASLLLGVLTVNIPIIMQFWFGSSFGSRQKTELLSNGR